MILDTQIEVCSTSKTKPYYESLGYKFVDKKTVVSSLDLPLSSSFKVTRVCDGCGEHKEVKRSKADTLCKKCTAIVVGDKLANEAKQSTSYIENHSCEECGGYKSNRATVCIECSKGYYVGERTSMYGKKNEKARLAMIEANTKYPDGKPNQRYRSNIHNSWAKNIKEKFNYTCQCCSENDAPMEAHHYDMPSDDKFNHEYYQLDSGTCLCYSCHKEFHKTFGYGDNSYNQYLEFKRSF